MSRFFTGKHAEMNNYNITTVLLSLLIKPEINALDISHIIPVIQRWIFSNYYMVRLPSINVLWSFLTICFYSRKRAYKCNRKLLMGYHRPILGTNVIIKANIGLLKNHFHSLLHWQNADYSSVSMGPVM